MKERNNHDPLAFPWGNTDPIIIPHWSRGMVVPWC